MNTSLEQAKVREAQSVRQSISSDLSAITAPAQQQLAAHNQALENQFSDSATRTNAEREAANQAVQQAVEQAYQQIDALITSADSRVNAGELAQINQSIRAMAGTVAATFTRAANQQVANANALIESQRQTVNQASTGAATQVSVRVAELIAQVQATPTRDIAASAQQSLKQVTDTAYVAASNQIHIASHADTVKRQEVSAGIQSARNSAQAQLQALPGTTQAAITQAVNSYRFAASAAAALTVPGQGTVPLAETALATLRQGIANAIAALGRIATAGPGAPIAAALTAVFYSRSTASEEQDQTPARFRYGLGINAHELGFSANADLNAIAAARGTVELPYRLTNETRGDGRSYISVVNADGVNISKSVPVQAATFDPQTGRYTVTVPSLVPDQPPITLTWTPAAPPGDQSSSTTTPVVPPPVPTYTGVELQPLSIEAETYPGVVPDARDLIIVFPADSGLEPVYLMFRDRRDEPGIATGVGQSVSGIWLGAASQGEGAPIPAQIADQLRGKEFKNFKAFRKAFWLAVGADIELSNQFKGSNKTLIKGGTAPFTIPGEQVGGRGQFEIHHVIPVHPAGAVYDIGNMRIMTPKLHIQTHATNEEP